ncbi:MAG: hypothetical protein E7612_09630 [Ruminococcaceae bacterium]|nr:hypothetical protein [Oscillospiraceae bacterium]
MKERLFRANSKRTRIFSVITPLAIVAVLILNVLMMYFGVQKSIYFDMTPEGLYSLSDAMVDECDEVFNKLSEEGADKKVTVTFCTDPDYLISSSVARLTYFMALKLQNEYPDLLEVKTKNVYLNPTSVSEFKTTSLTKIESDDIIVSYGDRYRIASLDYFWVNGEKERAYYNGEYRIATMIKSVTAISHPVAYFVTDHGETYYDPDNPGSETSKSLSEFAGLLMNRGLEIKLLDLSSVERVPDDCALLIINNPREDFTYDADRLDEFGYVSDTEKLDRYLVMKQGAVIVAKDYEVTLPVFEVFLHEWGFDFSTSVIVDEESSLSDAVSGEKTGTSLIATYDTSEESYGYALYGEYADLSSAPLTIFENAGSVRCSFTESTAMDEAGTGVATKQYGPFLTTSDKAQHYFKDETTGEITGYVDGESGSFDLAAVCVRTEKDPVSNENSYSYLFCVNSPNFFTSSLLGEQSFANYDMVSAVVDNISRIDDHASMDLGALSFNSASGGGKQIISMDMSEENVTLYSNKFIDNDTENKHAIIKFNHGISTSAKVVFTTLISLVPLSLAVVGAVITIKRRYL